METKGFVPIPLKLYKAIEKKYYNFRGMEKDGWEHGYTQALADVLNIVDGIDELEE